MKLQAVFAILVLAALHVKSQSLPNGGFENGMNNWTAEGGSECHSSVFFSDVFRDTIVKPKEGFQFLKIFSDSGSIPLCKIKNGFRTPIFIPTSLTIGFNSYYINTDSTKEYLYWNVYFYNTTKVGKFVKIIGTYDFPRNEKGIYTFRWGSGGANLPTGISEEVDSIVLEFTSGSFDNRPKNFLLYLDNIKLSFGTVGMNDPSKRPLKIYPVPCDDALYIEINAEPDRYQIFNLQGLEVLSGSLLTGNKIDVSSLAMGFYTIRVIDNSGTFWQQKFIKQ